MSDSIPALRRWKDASPTLYFPFASGKKHGIRHTWKDVREGFLNDGVSTSLHRSTAHMTPTVFQSEIIRDEIKRAYRFRKKENKTTPSGSGRETPRIPTAPQTARTQTTTKRRDSEAEMLIPSPPKSAREMNPILKESGRAAYLETQRRLPYIYDHMSAGFAPSSSNYGFAARNNLTVPSSPQFHRRVTGMRDSYRTSGVFTSPQ